MKNQIATVVLLMAIVSVAQGGDWPTWRYDARRSNASPDALPSQLHLQWSRQLPPPRPAWPKSQSKLQYDTIYRPIVVGRLLIVGSTENDSVTAFHASTGEEAWRFYTDGPVRFAPAANKGRVFVTSDDGYLHCLDATSGKLIWQFNGGAGERRIVGNDRLISTWPIRGGPAIGDDTVYFAASIWPSMGIFIHAVDTQTGRRVWTNSETGSRWVVHPHGAPSFGSIVPQGYLAVAGENVVVPGGRSLPAVLDRKTGQLRHFQFGGKRSGGWDIAAHPLFYVVRGESFGIEGGASAGLLKSNVLTDKLALGPNNAYSLEDAVSVSEGRDRRGVKSKRAQVAPKQSWPVTTDNMRVLAMAGDVAYAGGEQRVAAFDVGAARAAKKAQPPTWSAKIDGDAANMLAGDDKLFVVTADHKILCFGADKASVVIHSQQRKTLVKRKDRWSELAARAVKHAGTSEGYAIAWRIGSGRLIEEIVAQSKYHVMAIDPDAAVVESFRKRMDAAGIYGVRVVAHVGDPLSFNLPPYVANLIVSEDLGASLDDGEATSLLHATFHALRPYGGAACFEVSEQQHRRFATAVESDKLKGAALDRDKSLSVLRRLGALPGAGSWTHQYADAGNSVVSRDELVKAPLGVLWFGGPSNDLILPRHGHGPSPQVAGGRLVIEGPDLLRCIDVYTGRLLWEKQLPGLGKYYNITGHFPGAGEIGSNYVTLPDAVYAAYGDSLLQLDPATGNEIRRIQMEKNPQGGRPRWGFVAASDDVLIAAATPVKVEGSPKDKSSLSDALAPADYSSASRQIIAYDRQTAQVLWRRDAEFNFRHNCIVLAAGKVFCVDNMSAAKLKLLRRRGIEPQVKPKLLALDARTGKEIWSTTDNVFGTFLNYSAEHDVLLQAGSAYRDRAKDEVGRGMVAYRGRDGSVLWKDLERSYGGPCLLWRDHIITNGGGGYQLELLTGKKTDWQYRRMYGCNTAVGSQHLLTFRSGAAGFCDLAGDSGTGNIGGFRSSCTANLIVADGVLAAPDYTRTCSCAYQNQSSLGLVHMPEADAWTYSYLKSPPEKFAINLGAPGDRRADGGAIWYDMPSIGGDSPQLPVKLDGDELRYVRHHGSRVSRGEPGHLPWVAASCVVGLDSYQQQVKKGSSGRYTVRLHFAELEDLAAGERVFDVAIQGKLVLEKFDIAEAAGGAFRSIVKQFDDIVADGEITISFKPITGQPCISGVEVIEQAK